MNLQMATCHPDKKIYRRGLCLKCYRAAPKRAQRNNSSAGLPSFVTGASERVQTQALSGFQFDYAEFGRAMAFAIKEGNRDHAKEARAEAHRLRMRAQQNETMKNNLLKWSRCSHMRSHPYSGTSRIAWATQSDGITRGTCMACACPFSPMASELPFPDEMKGWYERMIAVPMTAANNDFITGMVAAGTPA